MCDVRIKLWWWYCKSIASLDAGRIYQLEFDFNRESLSGIDFNIINPSGSRLGTDIVGFQESLVSTALTKWHLPQVYSVYKLQYTFFDDNGSDGSQGSIDNFYLFSTEADSTLVNDQYSVNAGTGPFQQLIYK